MSPINDSHYDLIVIGSGPAGQKGAIAAAKLNKKVAIVERTCVSLGGVCLHTGTVPSKTMREAILFLSGYKHRNVYEQRFAEKRKIQMCQLRRKLDQVTHDELNIIRDQLERNSVDVFHGQARFDDPYTITVTGEENLNTLSADNFLLATGTKPNRPANIPFDGKTVFDSDEVLQIDKLPRSMIVIGGGVIGIEYAIMFATLGVNITVVDGKDRLLEFCDSEIVDALMFFARSLNINFRLGENVSDVSHLQGGGVCVRLESQKQIIAETAFFSVGRVGDTCDLNLEVTGVSVDQRGRINSNESYQTEIEHIFAVGDVIGFPSLASVSTEQGRRAVNVIYGIEQTYTDFIPYGLFTIPEIAMVGKTEKDLTRERIPYEIGIAKFSESARGKISGMDDGLLKLLFHRETLELLGVHCIGESATEIVHIGQAVMSLGGSIEYFEQTVFNHPTMSESYKVAAFDGLNRINTRPAQFPATHIQPHPTAASPVYCGSVK